MYYRALSFPVVQMLFLKKHAMCTTRHFSRLWLHDFPGHVIHRRVFLSMVHMQDLHPSVHIIHSADSFSMATKRIPACSHSGILCSLVHMGHFQTRLRVAIRQFCSLWSKYKAMWFKTAFSRFLFKGAFGRRMDFWIKNGIGTIWIICCEKLVLWHRRLL